MSYRIEEADLGSLDVTVLARVVALSNSLSREVQPRSVDVTPEEFLMFANSPGMVQRRFIAYDDEGDPVALANGRYPDDDTNLQLLITGIRVAREHRRRGLGTQLLGILTDMAEDLGRTRLQGFIADTVPAGRVFVAKAGGTPKLDFHENVLEIADLDQALVEEWAHIGETQAPGYSVVLFDGEIPESHFDDIAHLYHVLERDMPMSEDFEPRSWDAEQVRKMQEHFMRGTDSLAAIVFDDSSGRAVGMSQMIRRHADPTTWIVTVTMVDPEHRGKSLGKWVKGKVNVAALEQWEGGIYQETGNAFTNEPMLAINHAMGFRHEVTITDCSAAVTDVRRYLESRP